MAIINCKKCNGFVIKDMQDSEENITRMVCVHCGKTFDFSSARLAKVEKALYFKRRT